MLNKLNKKNKLVLFFCFAFGLAWGFTAGDFKSHLFNKQPLKILLIKDTLPEDVIEGFRIESKTPIIVKYASDEIEAQKILEVSAQDFDVVTLMSHQVQRLIRVNKIETLDKTQIENIGNVAIDFKYPPFDKEGAYSIPLLWGINGYIYNQDKVPEQPTSVEDIFQNKFKKKISIKNSPLDIFSNLLQRNKISNEAVASSEIKLIKDAVTDLSDYISINTQDLKKQLINENIWIAQVDSGAASNFISENQKFRYVIPADGATIWTLNLSIVSGTTNAKQAHKFLNYLLKKEVALDLAHASHHAVTNALVDSDLNLNPTLKPSFLRNTSIHNLKYYEGLGQLDNKIQTLFKVQEQSRQITTVKNGPEKNGPVKTQPQSWHADKPATDSEFGESDE